MNGTVGDIVKRTVKSMPVEITEGEAALFNTLSTLSAKEVASALQELVQEETDPAITSRAFDALLKLDSFDKVQYLIDLYDESTIELRLVACSQLTRFPEKRAIEKLCEIILHDNESDVRFAAAEALALIGDETAVSTLKHVKEYDTGIDYEGHRVADMVDFAIRSVYERRKADENNEVVSE